MLEVYLKKEGYAVQIAHDGAQAVEMCGRSEISLVLMDIMMPVMNGVEAMKRIKSEQPKLPVLMLSARDETADIVEALDLGANEYITKPFSLEELSARIRAKFRETETLASTADIAVTEYDDIRIDKNLFQAFFKDQPLPLSKTEFDLLCYLVTHRGKVISREELLKEVWGYHYGGSNVVDVYINYLREKLSACTCRKIIETVRGRGYIIHSSESAPNKSALSSECSSVLPAAAQISESDV